MPSFDVVSEVDKHELTNAVDTANRELGTRFDFKGSDARFELDDSLVTQFAPSRFPAQADARHPARPAGRPAASTCAAWKTPIRR